MSAARFLVSGKVQGVWFRASARDQAIGLQLTGFARNLADGRVEVVADGGAEQVDELERWLQHGPPLAEVSAVQREELENAPGFSSFSTL